MHCAVVGSVVPRRSGPRKRKVPDGGWDVQLVLLRPGKFVGGWYVTVAAVRGHLGAATPTVSDELGYTVEVAAKRRRRRRSWWHREAISGGAARLVEWFFLGRITQMQSLHIGVRNVIGRSLLMLLRLMRVQSTSLTCRANSGQRRQFVVVDATVVHQSPIAPAAAAAAAAVYMRSRQFWVALRRHREIPAGHSATVRLVYFRFDGIGRRGRLLLHRMHR